ncbi:hypothetical protein [Pseudomonas sp. JUb96]|uniref:hypothetical protein n=1 Tax=Pseudomonas sp. JUb96 TaxID=2940539 RepID=UPI002226E400|nr:hypothetical protein [Pseudomonas sp. JUb96]MCW2272430.1 hypothetical protein [Pseudomonas sp. JUb96]
MLNDYGKSLFKPWLSVQNVVLVLAILYVGLLLARIFNLDSGQVASWVQAIGAIVSIWAAWSIAGAQGRRSALEARRLEVARCSGVIGILRHVDSVVDSLAGTNNEPVNVLVAKERFTALVQTLDKIDLLSLPSSVFVNAVCEVRQSLESALSELRDPLRTVQFGLHFRFRIARPISSSVLGHIALCVAETEAIRAQPAF